MLAYEFARAFAHRILLRERLQKRAGVGARRRTGPAVVMLARKAPAAIAGHIRLPQMSTAASASPVGGQIEVTDVSKSYGAAGKRLMDAMKA